MTTASDADAAWHKLYDAVEDALHSGMTEAQVRECVENAISSINADRLAALDEEEHDPYPHLAETLDP